MPSDKLNPTPIDPPAVPKAVVNRLSLYLRELQHLRRDGKETTSSQALGERLGFSDAQVRKDLAYFGHFGQPGIGYRCQELVEAIRKILGTSRAWSVAVVGIGNLGRALLGYKGFFEQGFHLVAAFDCDPPKIGSTVEGVLVRPMEELPERVQVDAIQLGMIAVPSVAAQPVADRLVEAGIRGIVNFAPVTLSLPEDVRLVGVDLAIELEQIAFSVANRCRSR